MLHSKITQALIVLTIAIIGLNLTACQKKIDENISQPSSTDTQVEETVPMSAEPAEPNNSLVANDIETQDINTANDTDILSTIDTELMTEDIINNDTNDTETENQ